MLPGGGTQGRVDGAVVGDGRGASRLPGEALGPHQVDREQAGVDPQDQHQDHQGQHESELQGLGALLAHDPVRSVAGRVGGAG